MRTLLQSHLQTRVPKVGILGSRILTLFWRNPDIYGWDLKSDLFIDIWLFSLLKIKHNLMTIDLKWMNMSFKTIVIKKIILICEFLTEIWKSDIFIPKLESQRYFFSTRGPGGNGRGGVPNIFFCWWNPCKILESYDNPFRERKKNAKNSGLPKLLHLCTQFAWTNNNKLRCCRLAHAQPSNPHPINTSRFFCGSQFGGGGDFEKLIMNFLTISGDLNHSVFLF